MRKALGRVTQLLIALGFFVSAGVLAESKCGGKGKVIVSKGSIQIYCDDSMKSVNACAIVCGGTIYMYDSCGTNNISVGDAGKKVFTDRNLMPLNLQKLLQSNLVNVTPGVDVSDGYFEFKAKEGTNLCNRLKCTPDKKR